MPYALIAGIFVVVGILIAAMRLPDVSESEARANLRRHLHELRRVLPPAPADPQRPAILAAECPRLPDQFTQHHIVGNIRERKFSEIWTDPHVALLAGLRNRKEKLRGRCATCKWLSCCNGNFRARAEGAFSDYWEWDPACYLSDSEIAAEVAEVIA